LDGQAPVASATASVTLSAASGIDDSIDDLPSGVDIVSAGISVTSDRFECQITVRAGEGGITHKSKYSCHIDFDDLEDESVSGCDADSDGFLEGGYRLGDNGLCSIADIGLNYRPERKGGECTGLPGVLCVTEEFAGGMSDLSCNGEVAGLPADGCRIRISVPLAGIAAERDGQCADADDGCLGGIDENTGVYRAHAYFRAKLKANGDRAPDTDDNEKPNSKDEALLIQLRR
jgi:hypothetical protein